MSTPNPRRVIAPHPRTLDQVVGVSFPAQHVDFVLIDLERDYRTGLYLTLALAKNHPDPIVKKMYGTAVRFFKQVDALMTIGDQVSLARARKMLSFPEPFEIRLGYAGMGSYGSGIGQGTLGDYVFDVLLAHPALRAAVAVEPDAICLIPGVAMDRSSDMVATITKPHLIEFTASQAAFWQFDPACFRLRNVDNCWDEPNQRLGQLMAKVPVDDLDRTFLLVPKEICRSGPPMSGGQYFRDLNGPDGAPSGGDGESLKELVLEDAARNPARLTEFVRDRMRDPDKFKPRREFRKESR
jgi:hypothetical protein